MSGLNEKTVLIVDDEESVRCVVAETIATRGHQVLHATNGARALDVLIDHPEIDLVLLDVQMPGMDGFEALERMREQRIEPIPVVMLTGQRSDEELMQGYALGADYYLTKPFRRRTLLSIIDYLIGDMPQSERSELEAIL